MAEPATATRPVPQAAASEASCYRPFTREEYFQMVDAGILGAEDRTELINGHVAETTAQNAPHFDEALTVEVDALLPRSA